VTLNWLIYKGTRY